MRGECNCLWANRHLLCSYFIVGHHQERDAAFFGEESDALVTPVRQVATIGRVNGFSLLVHAMKLIMALCVLLAMHLQSVIRWDLLDDSAFLNDGWLKSWILKTRQLNVSYFNSTDITFFADHDLVHAAVCVQPVRSVNRRFYVLRSTVLVPSLLVNWPAFLYWRDIYPQL